MPNLSRDSFLKLVSRHREAADDRTTLAVPIGIRLLADQLTPVLAYRRLVAGDARTDPSFLLESVEGGERQGRYSLLGSHPTRRVLATGTDATITEEDGSSQRLCIDDPLTIPRELSKQTTLIEPGPDRATALLPACFLGGWVGYAGYDTVRYTEPTKLSTTPPDDRNLPDLAFDFYPGAVAFDHVDTLVHVVRLALIDAETDPDAAYSRALADIEQTAERIQTHSKPLPLGTVERETDTPELRSNTTREQYEAAVERAIEYTRAGDIFQVVLGQRFERESPADPFDVYRALRAVNPSPYMGYMQTPGCILVAASPEILCQVRTNTDGSRTVTNRPLAGTRKRGSTPDEDAALEADLLADPKETAEHAMLVDLARNDVGRVAEPGSIAVGPVMAVERYSHVMHISSTVTGTLRADLDAWDALHAALPVGTVSGAPKIRAMQIIDELEPVKRGPYGGGFGTVSVDGDMDIALALRTIVVPTADRPANSTEDWTYHIQAAAGVVIDSVPASEFDETVNKARALARAIDLAEHAFGNGR
ncbi:MAG: anthranilate synthase component I [Planctomycetota bacterium]